VIPVHNGASFIRQALDSILIQACDGLEIIVSDDGSTDATADVIASAGGPVHYLHHEQRGPAHALNRGIERARGGFVAFLDADDLWAADKLPLQLACFREDPALGLCIGCAQDFIDSPADAVQPPLPAYLTSSLLARRAVFATVGNFAEDLRHTYAADWFLRARRAGVREKLLPATLLFRRKHHRNMSRLEADDSREEYLRLLSRKLARQRGASPP